jgi:hypothetical protein
MLSGCAVVHTPEASIYSLGQTETSVCTVKIEEAVPESSIEIEHCTEVTTKGVSGEFGAIVSALFGWIPWPM